MVIFLMGAENFLAHTTIRALKDRYIAKNPQGLELIDVDAAEKTINWADLRAAPLFSQTRLIIVRRVGSLPVAEQASLATYLTNLPASSIVVVWEGEKALLPKGELAQVLADSAVKKIAVSLPTGPALATYLRSREKQHGLELTAEQKSRLVADFGHDLWGLENELAVLALGGSQSQGKAKSSEPFALYRAVQNGNWNSARTLLSQEYRTGVPIELLIGSMAAALRKSSASNKYAATKILCDIDLALKTGLVDEAEAVALLRADLPNGRQNRVEWEELWEESLGG